jgi:hypothetical protein
LLLLLILLLLEKVDEAVRIAVLIKRSQRRAVEGVHVVDGVDTRTGVLLTFCSGPNYAAENSD